VDNQKAQLQQFIQQLMARSMQPKMDMQQPRPQFSPESMQPQGFDTHHETNKRADIGQALGNMGSLVHNMVAQHKQNQIRDAMNEWDGFNRALEKAQVMAGDPSDPDYKKKVQQALAQDPWVKANLDPANPKAVKRLKNMYKALNVDLLSGEENVHREGLKRFFKVQNAYKKMVGAKQKMDQYKQGPGMDPSQRTSQMQESIGKMMGNVSQPDPKQAEEAARIGEEQERINLEAKRQSIDKFEFKQGVGPDGKYGWFAFDKTDPFKPARAIETIGPDGKLQQVTGKKDSVKDIGKLSIVDSTPNSLKGPDGEWHTPSDPEFKAGIPGDPDWYLRKWHDANVAWAKGEASKKELAHIRAETYTASRQYGVIASHDIPELGIKAGDMREFSPEIINKYPGAFMPASQGMNAMQKESMFGDLNYTIGLVRDSAKDLKHGIPDKYRAGMILALSSNSPEAAIHTFVSGEVAKQLPDDVVNYMTALAVLQENAMVLRNLGGMGQGSDDLRKAIARAVPGFGTPDLRILNRQLDLYQGVLDRLHKGVPGTTQVAAPIAASADDF
jgi:hypothetical protein